MKKYYLLLTSLFLMAGTVCAQSFTDTTSNGIPLEYTVNSGTATVTLTGHGTPCAGTLNIPATVSNNSTTYTVTAIGSGAFVFCRNLTTVSIPNTVTLIDTGAFYNCDSLVSINIPSSVTSIRTEAFYMCKSLTTITLPENIDTIEPYTFWQCNNLTSITIPNSVTTIRDYAFASCRKLTSIIIPTSVITIGVCGFGGCTSVLSITIPNAVSTIGINAFQLVSNIVYHGNAAGIPWGALSVNGFIENGFVYSDSTKTTLLAYRGPQTSVTIPSTVDSIGENVFYYTDVTSITLLSQIPPALANNIGISSNSQIYVPCGAEAAYRADANWNLFTNILSICPSITAQSSDSTMGTVLGGGSYAEGDTATLTAMANCGYRFDRWNDSVTDNPRQVIVATDTTFTAFFVSDADTVFIHDTTTVRDTLMLHDTLLVHDTLTITDTLLVHDTLTVYDTLTIHDTVGVALAYYTLTVSADPLSGIAVGSGYRNRLILRNQSQQREPDMVHDVINVGANRPQQPAS